MILRNTLSILKPISEGLIAQKLEDGTPVLLDDVLALLPEVGHACCSQRACFLLSLLREAKVKRHGFADQSSDDFPQEKTLAIYLAAPAANNGAAEVQDGAERVGTGMAPTAALHFFLYLPPVSFFVLFPGRFDALDDELLKIVMKHLPFAIRLTCALSVCKGWRHMREHTSLWTQLIVVCSNAMRYLCRVALEHFRSCS